jgi:hypothetical protein
MPGTHELPRSKLRGISLAEFIDLIEASFEELNQQRLKKVFKVPSLAVCLHPASSIDLCRIAAAPSGTRQGHTDAPINR